jgi:hypothetical protein
MKKYLTTGVAAIAFVAAFTSCSKSTDLYDQGAVDERNRQEQEKKDQQNEMTVNEKYAFAFEKAFGKVGPNVDWGFSSKSSSTRAFTRAVGDYASYKGNMQPTLDPSFPTDCDTSNFLDAVPEGVEKLPADKNEVNGGTYYIDATTQKAVMRLVGTIYVTGNVDLSNSDNFEVNAGTKIYLVKGSTLKLGETSALNLKGDIYIAGNARLETAGHLKVNGASKIYNHGTVSVGTFEVNTTSFLYNVGTLTADNVNAESNACRIVNDGTINCTTTTVNAGSVQNNAEWTVTGTTYVTSNNSGWVNNGHWTTQNYTYTGGSVNVINNCYLEVTNDFDINLSSLSSNSSIAFKIDTGGGVLTKNFNGGKNASTNAISGPFKIVMGQDAVFKVTETATLESGRGEGFGFFGPSTGGYAVFQAKNIVRNPTLEDTWGAVTYGGHLYVSAETHFAQGDDGYAPHKFIFEQDGFTTANNIYAAGFKSGKPDINIPQTPCSPGFKGGDPLYRVIVEDLSASEAGDFDFNDVVFDVVKAEGGKTTLKLICAGGVLPLRVRGASEAEGIEIHSLFGETVPNAKGEYKMYNTGAGPDVDPVNFTVDGEYTTPEQIKNIIIEVKKNDKWMELKAETGKAACKILVDDTFVPVEERKNIADENGNFTDYVQGKFVNDFWWK